MTLSTSLNDRQRQIVEQLRAEGLLSINDLSDLFEVATQTIRRDINDLCDQGLARRVHGGVAPPSNPVNLNFRARSILNEQTKRAIAQTAAALIPPGSTVLLGIGTTVQYVAEALAQTPDTTIVTNNLEVATVLCNSPSCEVHVVAGQLRPDDRDLAGASVLKGYSRFVADFGVIGAGALDSVFGLLDYKQFDADVSNVIQSSARKVLFVADHSKWNRTAPHRVAGFSQLDAFITDKLPEGLDWPQTAADVPLHLA